MTVIRDLGKLNTDLEGVILLQGYGLTSNIYLILGKRPGLIDTGSGYPDNPLKPMIEKTGISMDSIKSVVLTHYHADHAGGLAELVGKKISVFVHPSAEKMISSDYQLDVKPVMHEETIMVGHLSFKVYHTPGHTPDGICLYNHSYQILISGDTVFPRGSFGRTDLPGGDSGRLLSTLKSLNSLSVRHLLPGHENPVISDADKHIISSYEAAVEYLTP